MDQDKKKFIDYIKDNYAKMEKELVTQLTYKWGHGSTIGGNREEIWKSLFERITPKKFQIARSVFVIDSFGNCSNEVDLAIFDEQYTPYIFNYGELQFIPIEAVAVVIECKSSNLKNSKKEKNTGISNWIDSINGLKTASGSIVRIAGRINYGSDKMVDGNLLNTQTQTRPIKILCHMSSSDTNDLKIIEGEQKQELGFDIFIKAEEKKDKLEIEFNDVLLNEDKTDEKNKKTLYEWYMTLNHSVETKEKFEKSNGEDIGKKNVEGLKKYSLDSDSKEETTYCIYSNKDKDKNKEKMPLLSFIFQFNQLLMLINNPMFFPHLAYVKMFNNHSVKN